MIITISGDPGSGKSITAKALAKRLGYTHYSAGDMRGEYAKARGMTLDELNTLGETDPSTDKAVDAFIATLAQKDNIVIDSRLAWHFIPKCIKIYLRVDPAVAAKRIYGDTRTDRSDEPRYKDVQDVKTHLLARVASDKKRYKKYYDIDHTNPSHYDLVLDTSALTLAQVEETLVAFVQKFK